MILFLYNAALLAALVLGAPWWLFLIAARGKYRRGLRERLGRTPQLEAHAGRPLLWVHAVSVGEVLAVSRLIAELDNALPGYFIAISATTATGHALARERFGAGRVFFCPLDLPWAVNAYLNALQPRMLILAETEFWPNLLSSCFRRSIPVVVVNARISDRSWPRYQQLRWLWKPILARISAVLAQSQIDAGRLKAIGCRPERVEVAGNLKFDVTAALESDATRQLKLRRSGLRLVVAGSTLEGEEALLLKCWPQALAADPRLVLVLAPRRPERFNAVCALLDRSGFRWVKRTDWNASHRIASHAAAGTADASTLLEPGQVVLLNTIGELASVYSLASVAFVGGSLIPAGGHNPLEPAQFGVPIVMGPHYVNFRAITNELVAHYAIRIVSMDNLAEAFIDLLRDRQKAEAMGEKARRSFQRQAGATRRCVEALRALLTDGASRVQS
jgi:3-deoxy-D-manno-octulosonic-acid transferase